MRNSITASVMLATGLLAPIAWVISIAACGAPESGPSSNGLEQQSASVHLDGIELESSPDPERSGKVPCVCTCPHGFWTCSGDDCSDQAKPCEEPTTNNPTDLPGHLPPH